MQKVVLLGWLLIAGYAQAQKSIAIEGVLLYRNSPVIAANVINNTTQMATITDGKGAFEMTVSLGDEIIFSSVQYTIRTVKITAEIVRTRRLLVSVNEKIQALEEIVVTPEDTEAFMELKNEEFKGYDYVQDKSTKITNSAVDEPRLTNGLNLVNIAKLAVQLLQGKSEEEKKNLSPSRILPYLFEDRFFIETLLLEQDEIVGFLAFVDQRIPTQDLLNKSKEFELIDYLINESTAYKKNSKQD